MGQRAALYCRVSTPHQTCDRQERDLKEFADRAGYTVVGTFREQASGAKNDRPERKKILALAQARKIDLVLVTELTRWGRSTQDLLTTLQDLHSRGVSLVAQTGFQFDLSTPQGKLLATLLSGLAEFERDLARERILSGLEAAKARGQKLGRRFAGDFEARVETVSTLKSQGLSIRAIALQTGIPRSTVARICKQSVDCKTKVDSL